jgi:hydroxymethylpyrimidine/phosphomethylpyrimidine kinase
MQTALTIAGSDSSGGAGIQADLRTFQAHGVFGTSALTAVTAQNTCGVRDVLALPPDLVVAQIDAVVEDLGADAVKIGMLANQAIVEAVAAALRRHALQRIVVDTVMVAKGGSRLLDEAAIEALRLQLLPLADVATANVPEAEALTGISIRSVDDLRLAASRIAEMGCRAVVVKGGHLPGPAIDVLLADGVFHELRAERIDTPHTHGTGCTFAAAMAARLALGSDVLQAAQSAKAYVTRAIQRAPRLGRGHGPLGVGEP